MVNDLNKVRSFLSFVDKVTILISGIAILFMMFLITSDVILRNIFAVSVPGAYEFSEVYLMPLIIFPILLFVYHSKSLPRLDFLAVKLSMKFRYVLLLIFLVIEILAFSMITWFGWQKALAVTQEGLAFNATGNMYPLYPFYYLVPISFGLLTVGLIIRCFIAFNNKNKIEEYLKEVE